VCIFLFYLHLAVSNYQLLQGLLPTAMLVYVGLDLGVNTEQVTNSFRPSVQATNEYQQGQGEGSVLELGFQDDAVTRR
jgi:hypothetical protein